MHRRQDRLSKVRISGYAAALVGGLGLVGCAQSSNNPSGNGVPSHPAAHAVTLSWMPSDSAGVSYNVYRGVVSGGPYATVIAQRVPGTVATDTSVQSGTTYYYVVTASDGPGNESDYSEQVTAMVP